AEGDGGERAPGRSAQDRARGLRGVPSLLRRGRRGDRARAGGRQMRRALALSLVCLCSCATMGLREKAPSETAGDRVWRAYLAGDARALDAELARAGDDPRALYARAL